MLTGRIQIYVWSHQAKPDDARCEPKVRIQVITENEYEYFL